MISTNDALTNKQIQNGQDSQGFTYQSINEMWKKELQSSEQLTLEEKQQFKIIGDQKEWYNGSFNYWNQTEGTQTGVLGGYPQIGPPDIQTSTQLLDGLIKDGVIKPDSVLGGLNLCYVYLDCGGGIGRISKFLLCNFFEVVDIVDQNPKYIGKAPSYIDSIKMRNYYLSGLQNFEFEQKYNCIWIQWVLGYLTDEDLKVFLPKCKNALKDEQSCIVVKQNVEEEGFYLDKKDNNIIRSKQMFISFFQEAGLKCTKRSIQGNFPQDLIQVEIFVLEKAS